MQGLEETLSVGREYSNSSGKQLFEGCFGWSKASHTREPNFATWLDSSKAQAPLVTDEWRIKVASQAHSVGFFGHPRKSGMNQIHEFKAPNSGQKRSATPMDAEQASQLPARQIKQRLR